jgi:tRNA(His) 5'-end guanylyltransferase
MSNKLKDEFGNRMKKYESITTDLSLIPGLPVCVRLDGKAFHTFTKYLDKPYDIHFSESMIETTKYLVEKTNAIIGYTQSDEISLIYLPKENEEINFFNGKISKLLSVLSSMCTAKFNSIFETVEPNFAIFDCRVWNVPSIIEAVNVLAWREFDARKNSISSACFTYYSDKECINKNSQEKIEMLKKKNVDWNTYPEFFKTGIYLAKYETTKEYIPTKPNEPTIPIIRKVVQKILLPKPIYKYIAEFFETNCKYSNIFDLIIANAIVIPNLNSLINIGSELTTNINTSIIDKK